jgi:hypothetical protein
MWASGELQQLLSLARETTWTFDMVGNSLSGLPLVPGNTVKVSRTLHGGQGFAAAAAAAAAAQKGGGAPRSHCSSVTKCIHKSLTRTSF